MIDFSAPVYEWGEGLVLREQNPDDIKRFEDLQGRRIGVLVDSVQFNMIKDMPDTKVSTYQDYSTLLADVRAGRIELGIIDPPSIIYQIRTKKIPGVKLATQYQPQKKWHVGLAVQKDNKALLDAVNVALAEMKRNGELAEIGRKWGVADLISK
ncbi:amino acid-binding periplasmic protein [Bordetella pertussis]|nr:amino acid-binding periplasmic protein [Bordetella pertussis]CPK87434.1 amino acid-binding periplasmic protein [Bordetella pertussis]CPN54887.1 amino acid-binding periplasmic protein [Bordetella pertussis]